MPPTPKRNLPAARGVTVVSRSSNELSESRNISSLIPGMRSISVPDVRTLLDYTKPGQPAGTFPPSET